MKTLIFCTYGGLCNQIWDIKLGIAFSLHFGYHFTFKDCSFRDPNNLQKWFYQPFEMLFDSNFLNKYSRYINYNDVKQTMNENNNCFNYRATPIIQIWGQFSNIDKIREKIENCQEDFVCIPQCFPIFAIEPSLFSFDIGTGVTIEPCMRLKQIYTDYAQQELKSPYDCLHYRYEYDFTSHFSCNPIPIEEIIKLFRDQRKIYVATCRKYLTNDLVSKDFFNDNNIINKDEYMKSKNINLNYEENAFIDYCICLNSQVFYGHSKSSFSRTINDLKATNNYYS